MEERGIILYGEDENRIVKIKKYLAEYEDSLRSVLTLDGRLGSYELKRLFPGEETLFTNPKPTELLESLISFASDPQAVVLDFFAGSGTTAQAVLELNKKDGGSRRFILVQLPEWLNPERRDEQHARAFCEKTNRPPTLAEIMKERVRRVINKLDNSGGQLSMNDSGQPAPGFRVLKLAESNFTVWNAEVEHDPKALETQLKLHIDHVREGRTSDDILYEILLKSGFALTTPVERILLQGLTVYSVAGGVLLICLEEQLTLELIRAMAERKPERVICLDAGFAGNDQLKANAVQIFKTKEITSFKTI